MQRVRCWVSFLGRQLRTLWVGRSVCCNFLCPGQNSFCPMIWSEKINPKISSFTVFPNSYKMILCIRDHDWDNTFITVIFEAFTRCTFLFLCTCHLVLLLPYINLLAFNWESVESDTEMLPSDMLDCLQIHLQRCMSERGFVHRDGRLTDT